jgi:hypothetical protein
MTLLNLSPFPCLRAEEVALMPSIERDGFVDDAVVLALMAGPITPRERIAEPSELILAADELDFAGWSLPLPALPAETRVAPPAPAPRRAAPPAYLEPGLGEPHRGNHRWWLAGLAGAISTVLFSSLLLFLSSRIPLHTGENPIGEPLPKPNADSPVVHLESRKPAPQLTEVSP